MYKKITTIEEEYPSHNDTLKNVFSTIPNKNTDLGIATRIANRDFFYKYQLAIRDYLSSKFNKEDGSETRLNTLNDLSKNEFNKLLMPWYFNHPTVAEELEPTVTEFNVFTNKVVTAIDTLITDPTNSDAIDSAITDAKNQAVQLSMQLQKLNYLLVPGYIVQIWQDFLNNTVDQVRAKINKDYTKDYNSLIKSYGSLISGSEHLSLNLPGFADILTTALIDTQAWRFQPPAFK